MQQRISVVNQSQVPNKGVLSCLILIHLTTPYRKYVSLITSTE